MGQNFCRNDNDIPIIQLQGQLSLVEKQDSENSFYRNVC